MALNRARTTDTTALDKALAQAKKHVEFVSSLYLEQLEGNRYFLHEHPLHATSWSLPCMERACAVPSVQMLHGDQCQFRAEVLSGSPRGS